MRSKCLSVDRVSVLFEPVGPRMTPRLHAETLYKDDDATLDDLREAVTTLEDATRTARRVLGGAHPDVLGIGNSLQEARAALCARETPSPGGSA